LDVVKINKLFAPILKYAPMSWVTEYKQSLKMPAVEEAVDMYFYRPLAFLLVKSIYHTRITPDHLTLGAIFMGITGGVFYAFGMQQTSIIGAIFYALFVIFDCSDGQLARLKKNGTKIGRLLDGIADYIAAIAIYVGIAVGYAQTEGKPNTMLILLFLSGASIIVHSVLVDFYRNRFLDVVLNRQNTFTEGVNEYRKEYNQIKNQKGRWLDRKIIMAYLIFSNLQKKVVGTKKREVTFSADPQEYYKKNRLMMRLWLVIGPSAIRTALILCTFFGRFDIYFWITIVVFNVLAVILGLVQRQVDKSFTTS
jgi:phosphatidylglycerophosphate synthase